MIKITLNNSSGKLSGDKAILNLLYEELRFKHPNAYYIQQRVSRSWDGYINPISPTGVFQIGMLSRIAGLLCELEADIELTDYRVTPDLVGIPENLGGLKLRPYQLEALTNVGTNRVMGTWHPRGVVSAGVGAGKTLMMFGVFDMYDKPQTLIAVNNSALYDQILKDLQLVFPEDYGFLRGKQFKPGKIVLTMTQTATQRVKTLASFFESVRVVLVDEVDDQVNDSMKKILKACSNAPVRLGFTGTSFVRKLKKDQLRNYELEAIFGPELFSIGTEELASVGVTTKTVVKLIKGPSRAGLSKGYVDEVIRLTSSPEALEKILTRVLYNMRQRRGVIMIYNRFIPVAEAVYEYLSNRLPQVGLLDHNRYKANPKVLEDFREGKIRIMVNTLFLKRGLNLPKVRVIINNSCGDYPSTALQVLGRGVRLDPGKEVFYFEDLMYDGDYVKSHNKSRIDAYKRFGYEIKDFRD